jgi:DNA-3-methyladenine glycosylase
MITSDLQKLPRRFYTRSLITVAKELLGKILVKNTDGIIYSGIITEVEAYDGLTDEAAHSFSGKTPRNQVMFGPGGYFYVYFTYGAHFCCNVVTGTEGTGTAVLIRAVQPLDGIENMIQNRFGRELKNDKEKYNLTNGPGKVCKAFSIDRQHYGEDLTGDRIYLLKRPAIKEDKIIITKRIGITRSVDLPWRFYIKDNPYISGK